MLRLLLLLSMLLFSACTGTSPYLRVGDEVKSGTRDARPDSLDVVTFYALGDWGTGGKAQHAVAAVLRRDVAVIPAQKHILPFAVGLGDNVYAEGLPAGWARRQEAVQMLHQTFGAVYENVKYADKTIDFHIVPGNHDYAGSAMNAQDYGDILHQETTAEALFSFWKYYPIDPAINSNNNDSTNYSALARVEIVQRTLPQRVDFGASDKLDIFAIDTQVMLDLYAGNDSQIDLHWQRLNELVAASSARWKILIGHHPVRSHGKHGGFTEPFWWIPPLTIVPIIDKLFVKRLQDLDHQANRRFQKDMVDFMKKQDVQFYLAGHDHSLQFMGIDTGHFQVISGSAAKLSGAGHGDETYFSHKAYGFVRFDITEKQVWLEFFAVDPANNSGQSTSLFTVQAKQKHFQ